MNDKTRTTNSIQNIIVAMICQLLGAILGFVAKTIFIKLLGDTYNGMLGFFANVISVLSLAELGLGGAIIFALYKPISENNIERLQSLMLFYKKIYYVFRAKGCSQNTHKRIEDRCKYYGVSLIDLELDTVLLGSRLGKQGELAAVALTDASFAQGIEKLL